MEKINARMFCYWLQGAFELRAVDGKVALNDDEIKLIQEKLNSVFLHDIDPSFGDMQEVLNNIHNTKSNKNTKPQFLNPPMDTKIRC